MVVFVPSYSFEKCLFDAWKQGNIVSRLEALKPVFREPKQTASLPNVLQKYADKCRDGGGKAIHQSPSPSPSPSPSLFTAILFCVVGGKMSEGINFKDELARLVVVIGLPFANLNDPEMKERMQHMHNTTKATTTIGDGDGDGDGRSCDVSRLYYETLCLRAVNQSIGRAIRHRGDHAAIVLIDERFQQQSMMSYIPEWIRHNVRQCVHFGQVISNLASFYRRFPRPQRQ